MSIAPNLTDVPMNVLQQAVLGRVPNIPPFAALARLQEHVKQAQMQQAMAGQAAMSQQQQLQQQPPVAQSVIQAAQGLEGLPTGRSMGFASGGIVAFAGGESVKGGLTTSYLDPYDFPSPYATDTEREQFYKDKAEKDKRKLPSLTEVQQRALDVFSRGLTPTRSAPVEDLAKKGYRLDPKFGLIDTTGTPVEKATRLPSGPTPKGGIASTLPPADSDVGSGFKEMREAIATERDVPQSVADLRKQVYESAEGIAKNREAREVARAADIAARKTEIGKVGTDILAPRVLAGMLSGMEGRKHFADLVSGAARGAAGVTEAQRLEKQKALEGIRREEIDLDAVKQVNEDYRQAILNKRLADASGDTDRIHNANKELARLTVDKAKIERDIAEKQADRATAIKVANIKAAVGAEAGGGMDLKKRIAADKAFKSDPRLSKALVAQASIPGAMGDRARAEMLRIQSEVYNRHGVPLESDTSAQSGAGAGKIIQFSDLKKP